jgi:hypothetical protein
MNGDDAAYPLEIATGQYNSGLAKRELIAAMAMQGLLFDPVDLKMIAKLSVKAADALIAELSKEVQGE